LSSGGRGVKSLSRTTDRASASAQGALQPAGALRRVPASVALVIAFAAVPLAPAAPVWTATFDTAGGYDGRVEFVHGNGFSDLFDLAGASGGKLTVVVSDIDPGTQPNEGGRLLNANGTAVTASAASFSGYYKFAWSQVPAVDTWTAAGFLSSDFAGDSNNREIIGAALRHWTSSGHTFVNLGGYFRGSGLDHPGYKAGVDLDLGAFALNQTYQMVISWNNATHELHNSLYNASGNLIADNDGDLDSAADYPDLHILSQATLESEINATKMKYLGWRDFTNIGTLEQLTYRADTVSYFNTATGAFGAVEILNAPAGCNAPWADADGDGDVDGNDFGAFQRCYTGTDPNVGVPPACHCFDRPQSAAPSNNLIDVNEFAQFVACKTRAGVPANPNCASPPCIPGTVGCGWMNGDLITYNQAEWGDTPTANNAAGVLQNNYPSVYASSFGVFEIGIPGAAGFSAQFTSVDNLLAFLPAAGVSGPLNTDLADPSSSSAGVFGGEVAALKLNVDFCWRHPRHHRSAHRGRYSLRFHDASRTQRHKRSPVP
jgi:hypothetical protein